MKKLKLLVVMILIIFVSGCTVNYNIVIDEDLSIKETAILEESVSYFEENYTYYDSKEIVDSLWNLYIGDYEAANYSYTQTSNHTGVNVTASYQNLEDYKNRTTIYYQLFQNVDYNIEGDVVTIKATDYYPYNDQDPNRFAIDKATITITVPFEVIETNADKKNNNVYIWNVDKYDEEKEIIIQFNKSKLLSQKENKNIYYFLTFGIIVAIICTIIFVNYKIKSTDNSI